MLALGIRYLTGYSVATDVSNRERAEWPPHPARIYMALAASYFETGEDSDERDALEWLEQQDAPLLSVGEASHRDVVTCYVPVNDLEVPRNPAKLKPEAVRSALGIIPQFRSNKQPRTFPRVWVEPHGDGAERPVFLVWPDATPDDRTRRSLERICENVIRIGHSSSLVQMWVEDEPPSPNLYPHELGERRLRTFATGTLEMLRSLYNQDAIEQWAELSQQIATSKGKAKKELKKTLDEQFPDGEPRSLRPTGGPWHGYRNTDAERAGQKLQSGPFDRNLMVFNLEELEESPILGLESTWKLLTALHKTLLSHCDPAPEWLSGHQEDGTPSQTPHVALLPLPFVGHRHADGHLLGVALAFPNDVSAYERGAALRGLIYDDEGETKPISLRLGSLGAWSLVRETRATPPIAMRSSTWTRPSEIWATVTPIVLDRHPKAERGKDRNRWACEVADLIADSCARQGLPRPAQVDIDKTAWFAGAPRAVAGNGGGFPRMPVKSNQPLRQQVHAWIRFETPVEGPVLIGAGRYRGYGLCRPWHKETR